MTSAASVKAASTAAAWTTVRAGLSRPAADATGHSYFDADDRNWTGNARPEKPRPIEVVELAPATIEAIATRIAELLRNGADHAIAGSLIDAAELARRSGVSRTWIYQHAEELGAIKLGTGPKARLRFQPEAVEHLTGLQSRPVELRSRAARTRTSRQPALETVELLPITGQHHGVSRRGLLRRRGH